MLSDFRAEDQRWYELLVKKDSTNYKAIFGLALIKYRSKSQIQEDDSQFHNGDMEGNSDDIIQLCRILTNLRLFFDKSYELMAFIYLHQNKLKLAAQFATKCLQFNPANIFAQYIQIASNETLTAAEIISKVSKIMRIEPKYVRALHFQGEILLKAKSYQKALLICEKCLAINKHYQRPMIDIGAALIGLNRNQEAIAVLKSIQSSSFNDSCYQYLGIAHQNVGNLQMAVLYYREIDCFRYPQVCLKLAKYYFELKGYRWAINYYDICSQKDKMGTIMNAIACCQGLQEYQRMIDWLHKWSILEPQNCEVYLRLGKCYEMENYYEGAIRWFKKCIKKEYQLHEVYPKIIAALRSNNQYELSFQYADEYRLKCQPSWDESVSLLNEQKLYFCKRTQPKQLINPTYIESLKTSIWPNNPN